MRHALVALAGAAAALLAPLFPAMAQPQPLQVRAAVEAGRFMKEEIPGRSRQAAIISPAGDRFVARVVRGDIERNGIWLELYTGRLKQGTEQFRLVRRLFTNGLERTPVQRHLVHEAYNPIAWRDDRSVVFRWEDDAGTAQIVSVDVETGKLAWLTRSPTDVVDFRLGPDNRLIFQAAVAPSKSKVERDLYGGTYITSADAYSLFVPGLSGRGVMDDNEAAEAFLVIDGKAPVSLNVFYEQGMVFGPRFSPDGRLALMERAVTNFPEAWRRYGRLQHSFPGRSLNAFRRASERLPSDLLEPPVGELVVIDTLTGSSRSLWSRPIAAWGSYVAWSPDSRNVLLADVHPAIEQLDQGAVDMVPVTVVEVASGRATQPKWGACKQPSAATGSISSSWQSPTVFSFAVGETQFRFERSGGEWVCRITRSLESRSRQADARIEVVEDLNEPPRLYRVTNSHRQLLLDPNPGFSGKWELGEVRAFTWPGPVGGDSSGLLYYPIGYQPTRRYPIVIQIGSGRSEETEFSLYGWAAGAGLGPGGAVYAAQLLAARGIMVLSFSRPSGLAGKPDEAQRNLQNLETAIQRLDELGLIDVDRIGLVGFSRSGWVVEYGLTHSDRVFAAAVSSDSTEAGYVHTTLQPGYNVIGTEPFGQGLERWLEDAPTFNAERIQTPLRVMSESPFQSLMKWEMFARLRELGRPVEYYEVPDIEHSYHAGFNPRQSLAQKEGVVDWFDFWLNGREDSDPEKARQYGRWRELEVLRNEARKSARPPLLDWSGTAVRSSMRESWE